MNFEPIDLDEEDAKSYAEWKAERVALKAQAQQAQEAAQPPAERRTTKRVKASFFATFHGSYVPADEIRQRLEAWLDAGFNDRDDLRTWELAGIEITEESGDPDGYDS